MSLYRFTNVYRAADRVTQFLINEVIPGSADPVDAVFRTLLFKVFNRVPTWKAMEASLGSPHLETYDPRAATQVLSAERDRGERVYSAAYIMPMPQISTGQVKHEAHLHLLAHLSRDGTLRRLSVARSLAELYAILLAVPSFGPFLGFQFAIDINYGPAHGHSEMDYVIAGPGARSGIAKCFRDLDELSPEDIIRYTCERATVEFERLGLGFDNLWGRSLHLIDCQNLFCEVDKYARVAHPEYRTLGARTRIKQRYAQDTGPLRYGFPTNWSIAVPKQVRWLNSA